jgi:tRNA(adenine34) deaminase
MHPGVAQSIPPRTHTHTQHIYALSPDPLIHDLQALASWEVPVGAVLVSPDGSVVSAAHNQTEQLLDPTAHAEILCMRRGAQAVGSWRLIDFTLYVTLEPCAMCAGAAYEARLGAVVYGARSPLLGADGSWMAILPPDSGGGSERAGSSSGSSDTTKADESDAIATVTPHRPHPMHARLQVRRGVRGEECGALMKHFFDLRRRQPQKWREEQPSGGALRG